MAKTKKCGGCHKRYEKQPDHPPFRNWCSFDCAIVISNRSKEKAYKKETISLTKVFRATDTGYQHKLTQKAFNKMRKLEELEWFQIKGLEPECISCGKTNMDWCCGHFKTVGSQANLRYSDVNTKLQCNKYCNMSLSGNINGNKTTRGYRAGLIERFGYVEGNWIIDYCETHTEVKKWQCDELIERRQFFNKRIRELESET